MSKKSLKKRFAPKKPIDMGGKASVSPFFIHIIRNISWKIIFAAITTIGIGYILLSQSDPGGMNIYSTLAPIFLIGGHILVVLGLVYTPNKSK
ncbi:MAG: hypothetical protein KKD35_06245 [Elusimicrobia bacterium]|nr:hypothetical protein [Elusimicrobiota bacterium]